MPGAAATSGRARTNPSRSALRPGERAAARKAELARLLDFPLVLFVLFLFVPFWAARFRNEHLDLERARTDLAVTQLEEEVAAADPPKRDVGAYRT